MTLNQTTIIFIIGFLITLTLFGFFSTQPSNGKDRVISGLLLIAAFVLGIVIYGDIALKMVQHPDGHIRTWNVFHHYLGAKYLPELGYTNLYNCALSADAEMQGVWDEQTPIRHLNTYIIGQQQDTSLCPKTQFTPSRWAWFRSDLLLIQNSTFPGTEYPQASDQSSRIWRTILTDKGFNPTPVWATVSWWLTNRISLASGWSLKFLLSLDVILMVVALVFVGWVYGLETAALIFVFLVSFWGPYQRLVGNIMQYVWLFAVLMGFCFWRLGWLKTSAAFFAYAIMTRLFPVFFLVGLLIRLIQAIITRTLDSTRPLLAFFAWVLLFCWLFFMVSFLLPNGPAAWFEFYDNIRLHGAVLHSEMLNVGLKNLLSTCCTLINIPGEFEYAYHLIDRLWLYYLLGGGLMGLFISFCLRRQNSNLSLMSLGYVPMFALVTLSRYYYIGLAVMLLSSQNRRAITVGLLGTNLIMYVMRWFLFTQDETMFYSYWTMQVAYLLFFTGLLVPYSLAKTFVITFLKSGERV